MTKYMKITTTEAHGNTESPFIDLYKINNINEVSGEQRGAQFRYLDDDGLIQPIHKERPHTFFTTFTAPGSYKGYTVNGTAKELITHIEKQQKRAQKGLEIEPYQPKRKLYTESGKVHVLNQSYEPNGNNYWVLSKVDT
jgi:hypothetical protein